MAAALPDGDDELPPVGTARTGCVHAGGAADEVATSEVPSDVAVLISNLVLVAAAAAIVLVGEDPVRQYLIHPTAVYAYAAGLCLAVGILAYYRALALGPVSVVTPVFGLFIVISSALGVAVLDEPLTARKVAGVGLAVVAVYLTSVE